MSIRLHYARRYEIDWSGGLYSGINDINSLFMENIEAFYPYSEFGEYSEEFEVDKKSLEEFVKKVKGDKVYWEEKIKKEYPSIICEYYSLDDFLEFLEEAINNSPIDDSIIHFCWF